MRSPLIDACLCGIARPACRRDAAHDDRIAALAERDALSEDYIPRAGDSRIAYFGRTSYGAHRARCVLCNDADPLADASPIYGEHHAGDGTFDDATNPDNQCATCGTRLADLSRRLQTAHDAQQRRWSRVAAPTALIEYGVSAAIRCRVY